MAQSVTSIIEAVRRRAAIPSTSAEGYTDDDLLNFISDELDSNVYPVIVDMVEDFFITKVTIPLRDPNNNPYYSNRIVPLPARCFGWQVREIKYRDTANNTYNIPQISLEDDESLTTRSLRVAAGNFVPGFFISNDSIRLIHETTNLGGFLDITYVIKPSALSISTTLCPLISNITKTLPVQDVSTSPTVYPQDTTVYIGTAQAGSSNTITLALTVSQTSQTYFNNMYVYIASGTGMGQTAHVSASGNMWVNATKVLTVDSNWVTQPDVTSIYHISTSTPLQNDTKITPASIGTDLNTYCPDGAGALFDVFKKSTGAIVRSDIWMMRNGSSFYTAALTSNDAQEIMNYQQGGFNGVNGAITQGYANNPELVLCPAGQNIYTTLPKEADQLLIAAVTGRYLESLGDTEGLSVVKAQEAAIKKNLIKILGRRMIGECKVFVNRRGWRKFFVGSRWGGY
jgi:hypothetical protein